MRRWSVGTTFTTTETKHRNCVNGIICVSEKSDRRG